MYLGKIDGHTFVVNAISSVTFYGKSVMWFLTALFLSQVILILLQRRLNGRYVIALAAVTAVVSYFLSLGLADIYNTYADSLLVTSCVNVARSIVRAGIVLPFVALGYYGKGLLDRTGFFGRPFYVRLLTGVVLLVIGIFIAIANWSVDTNNMVLGNPFLYYTGSIAGSLAVIFICSSIKSIPPLEYIGRNSLVIMAIHLDLYVLWAGLQFGKIVYRYLPYLPALTVTTVTVTLILGSAVAYIVDRFFPFVLGKTYGGRTPVMSKDKRGKDR